MWAMRLNSVRFGSLQDSDFAGDLEDSRIKNPGVEHCAFLEVEHLYRSVGCARGKHQYLTAPQNQRSYRLMLVCVWMVYLRSTCGILVTEVLRTNHGIPEQTQASTRENGAAPQSTPKIEQVLDQNVDLSNIDQVPSNAHLSEKESQLYIFEVNEAVIKMIIKGRSPTMRHVSRTHRVALDWLFDRTNLDVKIQIKYVESRNQLADILTKGSFTRDEWYNLLHLFNIMNDTTFSCSHFSKSHPFLSAGAAEAS